VNAQEKVHDWASGRKIPSQVEGWKTDACAVASSGFPARTNRFQSGRRPLTSASRTAARQGMFANARSDRIGFATPRMPFSAATRRHGSCE